MSIRPCTVCECADFDEDDDAKGRSSAPGEIVCCCGHVADEHDARGSLEGLIAHRLRTRLDRQTARRLGFDV